MSLMIRKGIILAGGKGSRLRPLTDVISKQLLPIYNKPMIFYPLSCLINMGVKEVLIISDSFNMKFYKKLLGNGKKFKIKISYQIQIRPNGIAAAYILAKKFLNNCPSVLILGDNIFYGSNLIPQFKKAFNDEKSSLFTYEVDNPSQYGVLQIKNKKKYIVEKPKKIKSRKAIVGIYFLDNQASKIAASLKYSKRKELEITDLNNIYLKQNKINIINLDQGSAWLDTGSFEGLLDAANFVRTLEKRQGLDIAPLFKYKN
jgi:glucose-1-phosphate thymidylyltransferase